MTDASKAGGRPGGAGADQVADRRIDGEEMPRSPAERASLGEQAQVRIGNSLRTLYDSIVQQPVPDRFRELIERLDAQERKTP